MGSSELPSRSFGRYPILRPLGEGGAGAVFLACAPDGREVAVKLLRSLTPAAFSRFEREAHLLRELGEQDGFVPLLDLGLEGGVPYLIMPFMAGGTLAARLHAGPLPLEEVRRLGSTLGRALAAAHAREIVHRDLKPENILFDGAGRPLVADLGLGKHLAASRAGLARSLSKSGDFRGTVGYAPPEQLRDTKGVGTAADVFALGAVLYEGLAGIPAFCGSSPLEVVRAVESGQVATLRMLRPECPLAVEALLRRCLERTPERRPQDGAAFLAAWEAAWAAPPRAPAARPARWAAAVVASGLGVAGSIVALAPAPRPPGPSPSPTVAPPAPSPPPAAGTQPPTAAEAQPPAAAEARPPAPGLPLPAGAHGLRLLARLGPVRGKQAAMMIDLDVSPDGRLVATSGLGGVAAIWDLERDLAPVQRLVVDPQGGPVNAARFSRDGRWLHVGASSGLRTYDVASGRELRRRETPVVHRMLRLPDGSLLATLEGGALLRFAPDTLEEVQSFPGHHRNVAMCADSRGEWLFTVDRAGVLRQWRLEDRSAPARTADAFAKGGVFGLELSPDETRLVATDGEGHLYLWDVTNWGLLRTQDGLDRTRIRGPGHARHALWRADGRAFFSVGDDDLIHEWDAEDGRELRRLTGHWSWAEHLFLLPERDLLLSLGNDQLLRGWTVSTGQERWTDRGHSGRIQALAWAPDGTLWSAGQDATLRRWDPETGRELETRRGLYPAEHLLLGPDGRLVLGISGEQQALVWEVEQGRDTSPREGQSLVVAPLVSGGETPLGPALLTQTGELVRRGPDGFQRQRLVAGPVRAAAFTPDGQMAALFTTTDGKLTVVDFVTGEVSSAELPPALPPEPPLRLAVSGPVLLLGYPNGQVWAIEAAGGPRLLGRGQPAVQLAVTGDGRLAAAVRYGTAVVVYRVSDGSEVALFPLGGADVTALSLAFSPDGRRLALGTVAGEVLALALEPD